MKKTAEGLRETGTVLNENWVILERIAIVGVFILRMSGLEAWRV